MLGGHGTDSVDTFNKKGVQSGTYGESAQLARERLTGGYLDFGKPCPFFFAAENGRRSKDADQESLDLLTLRWVFWECSSGATQLCDDLRISPTRRATADWMTRRGAVRHGADEEDLNAVKTIEEICVEKDQVKLHGGLHERIR
jgi:hypothetical protein